MRGRDLQQELEDMTLHDLHIIATKLKIRGRSKFGTKSELIQGILACGESKVRKNANVTWLDKHRHSLFAWSGVGFGIMTAISLLLSIWWYDWDRNRPPDLSIAWYEKDDAGYPVLVDPRNVQIEINSEDMTRQRVPIPLRLAVRNRDDGPLEVVRIELTYDRSLQVESYGRAKIHRDQGLIVYEHSIGTLDSVKHYVPIKTFDTVYVPFRLILDPLLVKTGDGVPKYLVYLLGFSELGFMTEHVVIGVRVLCRNRPSLEGQIQFNLQPSMQFISGFPDGQVEEVGAEDRFLFQNLPKEKHSVLDQWSRNYSEDGSLISYRKIRYQHSIFQIVQVNGITRLLISDVDADGFAESELWDSTGDGVADQKGIFAEPLFMWDWSEKAVD